MTLDAFNTFSDWLGHTFNFVLIILGWAFTLLQILAVLIVFYTLLTYIPIINARLGFVRDKLAIVRASAHKNIGFFNDAKNRRTVD